MVTGVLFKCKKKELPLTNCTISDTKNMALHTTLALNISLTFYTPSGKDVFQELFEFN